jgi:hypothetical protein
MKKLTKYLVVTAILYLLHSFVPWQFDPSMWSKDGRAFFVLIWVCSMALVPMINGLIEQMKD